MSYAPQLLLACTALVLTFAACNKDDDDVEEKEPVCRVTKLDVYENNAVSESVQYTYTDDKLTKADFDGGYYTFEYANNQISKRNFYDDSNPNVIDEYNTVSYNADGTISKIEYIKVTGSTNERYAVDEFSYTGGKINKLTLYLEDNGTLFRYGEYVYTYTGNNITKTTATNYDTVPPRVQTFDYTFDANANYFSAQGMQLLLTDPLFESFGGIFIPALVSSNNVASIKPSSVPIPVEVAYTVDDRKNVQLIKLGGETLVGYTYQCQ